MAIPNMVDLLEKTGNKYILCILIAKRARELAEYLSAKDHMERTNAVRPLTDLQSNDPLEISLNEIKEGKISFTSEKIE